ncbi:hypothetical protein R1sor_022471 [Riccia sorocarpa]|uniref:Uncharacterized protein n=1 Tax=Riccia sorocarpa TaxID=122646 RepID=A0ABD3GJX3_9MARC
MAESAMATAESKEVITLKEAKAWLQSKSAGGSRVVRARLSRIGFRGKATYVGCPMCAKSIYARDLCVHDITSPKSFYRLKAYLEDATGELEATAWKATRCFTGMLLEEYVAKEMREEESEILDRCIGSTWIVRLGRAENHRGYYVRIEYAEAVSRKVLFPCKSPSREVPDAESLPSSPMSTISAFGDGSTPGSTGTSTCEAEYQGEKHKSGSREASRGSFRRGFEAGFVTCTILVSVGMRVWELEGVLESGNGGSARVGNWRECSRSELEGVRKVGIGGSAQGQNWKKCARFDLEGVSGKRGVIESKAPFLLIVLKANSYCTTIVIEEFQVIHFASDFAKYTSVMEEPSSAQSTPGGSQATLRERRGREDDPVGPDDLATVANIHRVVSHEMLMEVFPEFVMVGNNRRLFRELARMSHIRIMTDCQSVPMVEAVAEGHPVYYRKDHARRARLQ